MKLLLICLFSLNLTEFVINIDLNDEEVLSDIKFFNRSYAEIKFISSEKSMNVWLRPHLFDDEIQEHIIDKNCLFDGQVMLGKDIRGSAIISLCGQQITGLFEFNGTQYSLNSDKSEFNRNLGEDTKLLRNKRTLSRSVLSRIRHDPDNIAICGNTLPDINKIVGRTGSYEDLPDQPNIHFGKAVIKVAVFMDELLFRNRFDDDLVDAKQFVSINMAYLQNQLQQKNILKTVEFHIVVVHFGVAPFYDTHMWDITTYQRNFCSWARSNEHYADVNILLSGATLWWLVDGELSTRIKGLSAVGQLCNPYFSCLIVEAKEGFKSVRVLVHEFGHNLGAQHDGNEEFKTEECDPEASIMSWAVGNGKVTWSECSTKLMRLLLLSLERNQSTNKVECLKNDQVQPEDQYLDLTKSQFKKPGLRLTPSEQCRLVFGPKFSYYYQDQDNICLQMKCMDDFFITTTWGALEGTECGLNRKCDRDRCRRMPLGDFNKYVKIGLSNLRYVHN